MGGRGIAEILELIDEARRFWTFTDDPGPGTYKFGERHVLRITEHEIKKGKITTRYSVELADAPSDPLTMASNWELFHGNLSQPSKVSRYTAPQEKFDMGNMSIHDDELREKVQLKCKNDWDLDLTEDQISVCIMEMEGQRLSIFHNQIWPNKRRWKKKIEHQGGRVEWVQMERITWDKTIDGYRAVAHRTGKFAGMEAPIFDTDEEDGLRARITVYALDSRGDRQAYIGEARFSEFVQLIDEWVDRKKTGKKFPNNQWAESPHNQLSIAAERQALRKAFQEVDDDDDAERPAIQAPEPALEETRGDPAPRPPEERPVPAEPSSPPTSSSPEPELPTSTQEPKGTFVGIPKSGFGVFRMYNKDERIIMCVSKGGVHALALDSGKCVRVNAEGYETERTDRTDKNKGGRKWAAKDSYHDGTVVEKVADSKKDEWSLWLALNNGMKVCVDRWGKETKKKERKKKEKSAGSQASTPNDPPGDPGPPDTPPEANASGSAGSVDIEAVTTVEQMRMLTTPLLKRWCNEIFKKRVNPKQAYEEFTGVVLRKGQSMSLDDYKVLHQCLDEALTEAAGNE